MNGYLLFRHMKLEYYNNGGTDYIIGMKILPIQISI